MNNRQNVVNAIDKFDSDTSGFPKIGKKWFVKKTDFLNLVNQITLLTETDFESQQKYSKFFEFVTKDETKNMLVVIEKCLSEDHLEELEILVVSGFFQTVKSMIK